ncbi:MAG: glycosyltransferase [Gammaproteobacteria bacterium]|nr:glycosyltransferase [Gammaproteobacteria bacterium]
MIIFSKNRNLLKLKFLKHPIWHYISNLTKYNHRLKQKLWRVIEKLFTNPHTFWKTSNQIVSWLLEVFFFASKGVLITNVELQKLLDARVRYSKKENFLVREKELLLSKGTPLVSVLICTYNRSQLLKRAINSVLAQDFVDFELIVIDDCSRDDTPDVMSTFNDPRIRYIRNGTNMAATQGDRVHVRRFVYELMRGQYFVYLCDDDYWPSTTLLNRQIEAFNTHDNVAMVIGGQLSHFVNSNTDPGPDLEKISYVDYKDLYVTKLPEKTFFVKALYGERNFMSSEEFLKLFAENPLARNLVVGATLYSKKYFIAAGAMAKKTGSKWQAGYEFLLGPACYGNVVYLDEPLIVTYMTSNNASFQRTQLEHYLDSIVSIKRAFQQPLKNQALQFKRGALKKIKITTIRMVTRSFLGNTLSYKMHGWLTHCDEKNVSKAVRSRHAVIQYLINGIRPDADDLRRLFLIVLPSAVLQKMSAKGIKIL